jgi:hypothetical protein
MSAFYLNTTPHSDSTKAFCQSMHEDHQKLLALMIAQCHLQDLGKSLVDDPDVLQDCLKRAASSREILMACLKQLTESGANAYTHYVAYVQHFCARLTQELVVMRQIDTQAFLVKRYERLSNESLHQLELLGKSQVDFLEKLGLSLEKELQKHLEASFQDNFRQYFDRFMKEQTREQANIAEALLSRVQEKQHDQELRHNEWLTRQGRIVQEHLQQLQRQQEKLQDHQAQMDKLSETVVAAVNNMLPLARLHGLLAMVAGSYFWVTLTLRLAAGIILIVFLTRPRRCRPVRHYLLTVLVLEVVLEVILYAAAQQAIISELARCAWVEIAQKGTFLIEFLAYTLGVLLSFCLPVRQSHNHPLVATMLELEHLRQHHEQALKQLETMKGQSAGALDAATVSSHSGFQVPLSLLLPSGPTFQSTPEAPPVWYQHHGTSSSHRPSHAHAMSHVAPPPSFAPAFPPSQLRLATTYGGTSHQPGPLAADSGHPAPSLSRHIPGIFPGVSTDSPRAYLNPGYGNALESQSFGHESSHGRPDAVEFAVDAPDQSLASKKRSAESAKDEVRDDIKRRARTENVAPGAPVG